MKKRYPSQNVKVDIPENFIIIPMDPHAYRAGYFKPFRKCSLSCKRNDGEDILYVHTEEKRAVFEIIDNGCGIPKEKQDALFSGGFEKSAPTVDRNKNGMGIGLSVCATIIKAHRRRNLRRKYSWQKNKSTVFCLEMEDTKHEQ